MPIRSTHKSDSSGQVEKKDTQDVLQDPLRDSLEDSSELSGDQLQMMAETVQKQKKDANGPGLKRSKTI
jgi:hypothetical protein